MQILGYVNRVREVEAEVDHSSFTLEQVEANPVRCPDPLAADLMYKGPPPGPSSTTAPTPRGTRTGGYTHGRATTHACAHTLSHTHTYARARAHCRVGSMIEEKVR